MEYNYNINLKVKNDLIVSINELITRYLREGLELSDIKKYFKIKSAFSNLLKDINYIGRKMFDDTKDYEKYVKKIFNEVLLDMKSDIEMKRLSENKIVKYSEYLNESVNFDTIDVKYLFNDIGQSNEEIDVLSNFFNTKQEYIKSKNSTYSTYTITDFQTDVSLNNRTTFDVLVLSDAQIERMKQNIQRKMISEILAKFPSNIQYMGLDIKTRGLIDENKLKISISKLIVEKKVLELVSTLTKYTYQEQYGIYHIWRKNK